METVDTASACASAPTTLRPPAQGCRFGYPGKWKEIILNRKAVASFCIEEIRSRRNRVAVEALVVLFSPG